MKRRSHEWEPTAVRGGHERPVHPVWSHQADSASVAESGGFISFDQLPTIIETRLDQALRLRSLEGQIASLAERLAGLEAPASVTRTAYIQSFAPEPYELTTPIAVMIEGSTGECVATFHDANISASGETEQEAFENLKSLLLDVFDSLDAEDPDKLGPEPARQLAVLRSFVRGK